MSLITLGEMFRVVVNTVFSRLNSPDVKLTDLASQMRFLVYSNADVIAGGSWSIIFDSHIIIISHHDLTGVYYTLNCLIKGFSVYNYNTNLETRHLFSLV